MKATDLMIGDFVLLGDKAVKILSINIYNGDDSMGGKYYVITEPQLAHTNSWVDILADGIPLTPEILEKNGFVYADLPFENFYEGYGLHIHGGNYADGHSNWYIICGINVSMNVTHVHELQHALRLCGIDKEIVL